MRKRKIKKVGQKIFTSLGNWNFKKISSKFDIHAKKSIPLYLEGHKIITDLSTFFLNDNSLCYDLGSSTGVLLNKIYKKNQMKKNLSLIGIDISHSPTELKRNITFFYKHSLDLLIGSRYLKGSKIINWPISRKILSKLSNTLAKILLGVPVSDYTNGFRFYSKAAAITVISKCNKTGGGFIILSEIILILWENNYKISEIKSIFKNRTRGESSVNIKLIIESLIGLGKLYLLKKSSKI